MSCPWFYSENGSDYVAVGSTVTGNNISFRVVSLQNLDSSKGIYGRTYTQSIQAEATVKKVHLNRNWLLTGLFSSNRAAQIQLSISLKKFGVPKYVPQCNWHGAQAHTWAMGYLWNIDTRHSYVKLLPLWLSMLSKNSDINDTFFRQSLCTVECILPMQHNKSTPKKCPRNFSIRSYNGSWRKYIF